MNKWFLFIARYSIAPITVALVMVLKAVTDYLFGGGPPLILFITAVMFTSRFCGFGPGIMATVLSSLVCMYFYFVPLHSFRVHSTNDAFRLSMFIMESVALSALMESLHLARSRVQRSMHEALLKEHELRKGEQRFHVLVESIQDYAIIMLDPDGHVTSWNAGAERIKGYPANEIIGQHFSRFYLPEDAIDGCLDRVLQQVASGQRFLGEGWRVRKDGSRFWASVVIAAIKDEHGHLQGFAKVTRDITERKCSEEKLRRAYDELAVARDQALDASRAKSEFLANMSHEIRTPLNGVVGLAELILETELTREQRESMEILKGSADTLLTVINEILDFSKIEAGKFELESTEFVLRDLLEDTAKTMALRAHQKGLELACDIGAEVPKRIVGDPSRLRQVLVNLIGNAIKFTERGEVTIHAELASQDDSNIEIRFAVADTGIGIPLDKQQLIFEAFSQADGSTTRKYGGTGLGLTISSRLVGLMGGELRVESTEGKGSKFYFAARFGMPTPLTTPATVVSVTSLANLSVLVVDDNATNRRILDATLRRWGARPTLVDSGPAAMQELHRAALANEPYPLLLVDAMMPGMDGFSLVQQIRNESSLERPTIMMLSSADSLGDGARCNELGIAAYLVKPVRSAELHEAIAATLRGCPKPAATAGPRTTALNFDNSPKLRILLAEDNPVNQRVAEQMLTKRGHVVISVATGKQAVTAISKEAFDLVLMDVQMPEMDGFEATRAIRAEESITGKHIPIIAMTAHALAGDREKCLAVGMDDYVAKPIQSADLLRVIKSIDLPLRNAAERRTCEKSGEDVFDRQAALDRVEGNEEFLAELAGLFLVNVSGQLDEIREAFIKCDGPRLYRVAHSLKGALSYLSARPAIAAAEQIERIAESKDFEHGQNAARSLESEIQRLSSALSEFALQPAS